LAKIGENPENPEKAGFSRIWPARRAGFYINPSRRGPAVPGGGGGDPSLGRGWSLTSRGGPRRPSGTLVPGRPPADTAGSGRLRRHGAPSPSRPRRALRRVKVFVERFGSSYYFYQFYEAPRVVVNPFSIPDSGLPGAPPMGGRPFLRKEEGEPPPPPTGPTPAPRFPAGVAETPPWGGDGP